MCFLPLIRNAACDQSPLRAVADYVSCLEFVNGHRNVVVVDGMGSGCDHVGPLGECVGDYGVRLHWSSVPRSTELRSVVIHETRGNRAVVGDVLLAIGAGSVNEAVRWAASARAVVVLIRGDERGR